MRWVFVFGLFSVSAIVVPMAKHGSAADAELFLKQSEPAALEERLLSALASGDLAKAETTADEIRKLATAERQALKFRVRPGAFEFRFAGQFPQKSFSPEMLEYVIAKAGERDHETLVAADPAECERLRALGKAVRELANKGKVVTLRVKLLWHEGGVAHVEDLWDILRLENSAAKNAFVNRMTFSDGGLGAMNRQADPSLIPTHAVPMTALVTVSVESK